MYQKCDETIKYLNRVIQREFKRLRLLSIDELNIMRTCKAVYTKTSKEAKKRYRDLAYDAYLYALFLCGMKDRTSKAKKWRDKRLDKWLKKFLDTPDPVTKYSFDPETERKYQRTAEALIATEIDKKEIDKAMRYWSQQLGQYSIDVVDASTLEAYKEAGVEKVMWITARDERVCTECGARDRKIYPINAVPPKPHWNCRCTLRPVK